MKFIDPHHDAAGAALRPLDAWLAEPADDAATAVALAVPNDADVTALEPSLARVGVIALHFPKWTDGRAYSQARLLRSRLRFAGEIRATGEVLVDMLPLLHRTGFDAVVLRDDQSLESAQRALRFFAGHYQGDVVDRQPLFLRNSVGATA